MAVQSKAQQRKIIYFVLILGLFTVSLIHRKYVIEPRAYALQLRETARGEVELTSSAVRLMLTGSRGLAVTSLWWAAHKKQQKHDWNEVELLVSSITKLQPYFITPWLFQSWNLAFNVSVECDRPVDKYYYVSRGLQLLAEGERRNQGVDSPTAEARFPGNPDMRFFMGFYYQLKIGTSDEKKTMRCLLDLSCIDPLERDPNRFRQKGTGSPGSGFNLQELESFARNHPRLVRRLHDLDYKSKKQFVEFLEYARNVPDRFEDVDDPDLEQTPLKPIRDQFPALPKADAGWPDPENYNLTAETIDVFLMSRTWYQYAQKPLPEPVRNLMQAYKEYRPREHRLPKQMAVPVFRQYPCRAQMYIAEELEAEGWFDGEGWRVPDWFDSDSGGESNEVVIGKATKYHAGPAWGRAYAMLESYGLANGVYLTDAYRAEIQPLADAFRKEHGLGPNDKSFTLRPEQQTPGYHAWQTLIWNDYYKRVTNFPDHFATAKAERTPEAVFGRKLFFQAERLKRYTPEQALQKYQQAMPIWLQVMLRNPEFANVRTVQEDSYEIELHYLRHLQRERPGLYRSVVAGTWQMLQWPYIPWNELLSRPELINERNKILPIRKVFGPLSRLHYVNRPDTPVVKEVLAQWLAGATFGLPLVVPDQVPLLLTRSPIWQREAPPGWELLIPDYVYRAVRGRMRLPVEPESEQSAPQDPAK